MHFAHVVALLIRASLVSRLFAFLDLVPHGVAGHQEERRRTFGDPLLRRPDEILVDAIVGKVAC
jgi:hypothetical protein